jgi:hypothetical protein
VPERRSHSRHRVCFPIQVDSSAKPDRIAMCRNSSIAGMLLATPSRYQPGERLRLRFRVTHEQREQAIIEGVVVRVLEDARSDAGWWRRLVAVRFDRILDALEPLLALEAPRQASLYGF